MSLVWIMESLCNYYFSLFQKTRNACIGRCVCELELGRNYRLMCCYWASCRFLFFGEVEVGEGEWGFEDLFC